MTRTRHPNFDKVEGKELAFEDQGVKYYHFPGEYPIYQERFIQLGEVLRKNDQYKITDAILTEHITTLEALGNAENMTTKKLQMEVLFLCDMLKERRENSFWPQFHYELASIWFFDEYENPYGYDYTYGQEKIKRWLESPNRADIFFFISSQQLTKYIPSLEMSASASMSYTTLTGIREYVRSKILLQRLTSIGCESGTLKSLESQMETWKRWGNLDSLMSKNFTNLNENGSEAESPAKDGKAE